MGEASQTRKVVPAFGKELCVLAWPHGPLPSLFFPLLRSADIINLVEFLEKKKKKRRKVEKKEEKKWRKKRRKKERKKRRKPRAQSGAVRLPGKGFVCFRVVFGFLLSP